MRLMGTVPTVWLPRLLVMLFRAVVGRGCIRKLPAVPGRECIPAPDRLDGVPPARIAVAGVVASDACGWFSMDAVLQLLARLDVPLPGVEVGMAVAV